MNSDPLKALPYKSLLIGLLLIGALLRCYEFSDWSLHNDELSTLFRAKHNTISEVFEKGIKTDVHPALNEVFFHFWMKVAGDSPFASRLPYVIFSIIGLLLLYRFVSTISDRPKALMALALVIPSQLFVIYAQLARPYSIGFFLLMAFAYAWSKMIDNKRRKWILLSGLLIALCAMTHYFLALAILLFYLIGTAFIDWNRKNLLAYISSGLFGILCFLPHLPLTIHQIQRKGLGWLPKPEDDFLINFFQYAGNESIVYLALIAVFPLLAFSLGNFNWPKPKFWLFPLIFLISYFVGFYYSLHYSPVLQFSALIFSYPFFLIFLAQFIAIRKSKNLYYLQVGLMLIVGIISLIFNADAYGTKKFADFKGVSQSLIEWKNANPDLVVISNSNSPEYLNYYYEYHGQNLEEDLQSFSEADALSEASRLISSQRSAQIALGFANLPIPPEVYELARANYPRVIERNRYFNSEALLLGKNEDNQGPMNRAASFESNPEDEKSEAVWSVAPQLIQDSIYHQAPPAFKISSKDLYSLTFQSTIEQVFDAEEDWLCLSAFMKSDQSANIKWVVSVERNGESIDWRSMESKNWYLTEQWYPIYFVYALSKEAKPQDIIKIYFWNPDQSEVYLDDLRLVNYLDADFNYYRRP